MTLIAYSSFLSRSRARSPERRISLLLTTPYECYFLSWMSVASPEPQMWDFFAFSLCLSLPARWVPHSQIMLASLDSRMLRDVRRLTASWPQLLSWTQLPGSSPPSTNTFAATKVTVALSRLEMYARSAPQFQGPWREKALRTQERFQVRTQRAGECREKTHTQQVWGSSTTTSLESGLVPCLKSL